MVSIRSIHYIYTWILKSHEICMGINHSAIKPDRSKGCELLEYLLGRHEGIRHVQVQWQ